MRTVCQAIYKGIKGAAWENLCYKYVELLKALNLKKAGHQQESKSAVVNERRQDNWRSYDRSSERQLESETSVRRALWEAHMKSPTAALERALGRTEDGAGRAQSSTGGGSET